MKRLALLLAAMGIVSVGAMAEAPKLEVTNVGQEIEIENENGRQTFDDVWLFNNVGLKYGDWTIGLTAGKQWSVDFEGQSTHSDNGRLQMDIWKKVTPDLKLGTRLRLQDDYDRYYARWDYNGSNNMFFSWGDVWYESNNDDSDVGRKNGTPDYIKAETLPIGVKVGLVKVGYYFQYYGALGSSEATDNHYESEMEHQIRLYAPLYQGEKLGLSFEGRFTIAEEQDWNNDGKDRVRDKVKTPGYREYDSFGRTRLYVKFDYKVTESLNVYGQYAYEWRDFDYQEGDIRENYHGKAAENYQDILVGWRYTF